MFVTMPAFEQWTPLDRPLYKWRAATPARFLFAYDVECEGHRLTQTTAIAYESTLVGIVKSVPEGCRRAICRIARSESGAGRYWQAQDIDMLWLAAKSVQQSAGLVLFQLQGETCARNVHMHQVAPALGREVLFKRPQAR